MNVPAPVTLSIEIICPLALLPKKARADLDINIAGVTASNQMVRCLLFIESAPS